MHAPVAQLDRASASGANLSTPRKAPRSRYFRQVLPLAFAGQTLAKVHWTPRYSTLRFVDCATERATDLLWRLLISEESGTSERILRCFWSYRSWQVNQRLNAMTAGYL